MRPPRSARPSARCVPRRTLRGTLRAYLALTKPRIIELLLITTLPVMFLAARGLPPLWPAFATLVGGAASAGSANALNCYIDRDIDRKMRRTRRRPLAAAPSATRGDAAGGADLRRGARGGRPPAGCGLAVNWLSAGLALFANLFYVFGYSLLLKRRTAQNIVWGGLAGCMPALIGWTAITGRLSWAPLPLFLVVFFWTPPHFWALAMRFKEDYAAAEVPMLPVVASNRRGDAQHRQVLLGDGRVLAAALAGREDRAALPRGRDGPRRPFPHRGVPAGVQGTRGRRGGLRARPGMARQALAHRGTRQRRCSVRCACSTGRTRISRCSSLPSRSTRLLS